jgi:biopolymer transport protein ExbD
MKNNLMFIALIVSVLSCREAPKSVDTTTTENTSKALITENNSHWILVDSTGKILFGNQPTELDSLENKLVDSLLSIRKATGIVPDTILFTTKGDVLMGMRGALADAIQIALERARRE